MSAAARVSGVRFFGDELRQAKAYRRGTHRSRAPRETLSAYGPSIARCGITRIANVTGLDFIGIPVYTAIRPNSRSLAVSQGKGLDHDSAKASAMMEAIELWHAEHIEKPVRWESFSYLSRTGGTAVDPNTLPRLREADPDSPRLWIEGFDLLSERPTCVPLEAVTMNSVGTPERGSDLCISSNGLASGNHLLEAMVHGLCEVIERDAEALWRQGDTFSQLDLSTVRDAYCRQVLDRLASAEVFASAWDLTSDVNIPSFGCAIMEKPDRSRLRQIGIHYGFGTHLDANVALSRALTEAVQTRLTYISGSRDDFFRSDYALNRNLDLLDQIWQEVSSAPTDAAWEDRCHATDTFEDDLGFMLERLRAVGLDCAVAVDLSRAEIGIPVVKMVVPGLEGPDGLPGPRALRNQP